MEINVINNLGCEIYTGDAETFLFMNGCDSELESFLNDFEQSTEEEAMFTIDGSTFWTIEKVLNYVLTD